MTFDNIASMLANYRESHSVSAGNLFRIHLKAYLTWIHGGQLSPQLKLAFGRAPRAPPNDIEPLSEEDFQAMLRVAGDIMPRRRSVMVQSFLWFLWDSGFRIGEVLAMRVSGVRIAEDGLTAKLALPKDGLRLKTGPRSIYIAEAVPSLPAWLALHPEPGNPDALLFPAVRTGRLARTRAGYLTVELMAEQAGLKRNVSPHLFRHTCATRKAKLGWKEAKLRAHFGWGPRSPMPTHYVHLAESDMEETVKADAKVDPLGALVKEKPEALLDVALGAAMDRLLDRLEKRGRI